MPLEEDSKNPVEDLEEGPLRHPLVDEGRQGEERLLGAHGPDSLTARVVPTSVGGNGGHGDTAHPYSDGSGANWWEDSNLILNRRRPTRAARTTFRGSGRIGDAVRRGAGAVSDFSKRSARWAANRARRVCRAQTVLSKVPAISTAIKYNSFDKLLGDVIAGTTVALTVIPLGIGFIALAGLPLEYGMFASVAPGVAYALFGTVKEVTIGPTAVNSLMTYTYAKGDVTKAVTLAFFCGIIEMAAGLFNLGFLMNYISKPVISGFTTAVTLNVFTSQVKGLLGLGKLPGRGFIDTWKVVLTNLDQVQLIDAGLGFACLAFVLLLKGLPSYKCCCRPLTFFERRPLANRIYRKLLWLVSISRNTIVLIAATVIAYLLVSHNVGPISITGKIGKSIPRLDLPWNFKAGSGENNSSSDNSSTFEEYDDEPAAGTDDVNNDPFEIIKGIEVSGLVFLPMVSILQVVACAHQFTPSTRKVRSSQEILALGICQVAGSFLGSLPITASFGRCTVNSASGVMSTFGGVVTSLIIVGACYFLTPHFRYIPQAAIAAVLIASVVSAIDFRILRPIWKAKRKREMVPYFMTLLPGVLISVEQGIIAGTVAHICILLYLASIPNLRVVRCRQTMPDDGKADRHGDGVVVVAHYVLVQPDRPLSFPCLDRIRAKVYEAMQLTNTGRNHLEVGNSGAGAGGDQVSACYRLDPDCPIVFDLSKTASVDYSAALVLRALAATIRADGGVLLFCGANDSVLLALKGTSPNEFLYCRTVDDAVQKICSSAKASSNFEPDLSQQ